MAGTTVRAVDRGDTRAIAEVQRFYRHYATLVDDPALIAELESESAALPGPYTSPSGRLFYAEWDGQPAGCVGIRALSEGICELKRFYVAPEHRGKSIGRALILAGIHAARELGYKTLMADTPSAMRITVQRYRELGFRNAPMTYQTSVDGVQFLSLDLANWSEEEVSKENLDHLFSFNQAWATQMMRAEPGYFERLAQLQTPEYLWIGCSDSRVPANQIVGLLPGEVFVHRNVANIVVHTDLNCLSVIQFAVDVLKVKHIMVVGHYGCGGVRAALNRDRVGLVDLWLRHVQDVFGKHSALMSTVPEEQRHDRLCELNALEQAMNVCHSAIVQDAWARGQALTVHAWIYGLKDGLMKDLRLTVSNPQETTARYEGAVAALAAGNSLD
ncbi:MAG: carbonate dehydratase [Rhodocyclaceae bacterium]|nr:carbonate dehydratase [Rhodocyclaceae bacterium]MBK6908593.1 carbonate dehydratase [Rhodocyclaceae bacterium]